MPDPKMRAILAPQGARFVLTHDKAPVVSGTREYNFDCAACTTRLLQNVKEDEWRQVVVRCPACGQHNVG